MEDLHCLIQNKSNKEITSNTNHIVICIFFLYMHFLCYNYIFDFNIWMICFMIFSGNFIIKSQHKKQCEDVHCILVLPNRGQYWLASDKCKAPSLVFMRRCKGVVSLVKRRCIVHAKKKNNQLSNHSLEAGPQGGAYCYWHKLLAAMTDELLYCFLCASHQEGNFFHCI